MRELWDSLLSRLQEYFDPEKWGALIAEGLVEITIAAIVLLVFYLVWRLLKRLLLSRLNRHMDKTSAAFAETAVKYTMLGLGLLAALSAIGVQTTAVLASLGVVSLTIGFALRDTLSNIISGFLIYLDRPFTIGDIVEIDGKYGRVDQITLRTTRIVTNDGKMLAVPNAEVMNKTVVSYTNFPNLRLDVGVTVAVTEDLDRARKILLDLVQDDPNYLTDPPPSVVVTQLNDYNVALELRVWVQDERQHLQTRFDLREKVFKALTAARVEMPFETIQLIVQSAAAQVDKGVNLESNKSNQ